MSSTPHPLEVLVVVYDGVQLLDIAGPMEVFEGATRASADAYRICLASLGGRDVVTSSGVRLGVQADLLRAHEAPHTLMVAGGWGYAHAARDSELVHHVRRLSTRARRVTSVCTGAFVLAEAGLLDGRRATTHWAFCAELAESYPAVTVQPDAIFVQDPPVVTAAGVTAGVDLSLALVEADHGAQLARRVAKWLVVFMQRPGGQSQFSVWQQFQPAGGSELRELLAAINADPAADFSLPAMAQRLSMSTRHFSRTFTREVGVSPGRYVERVRVETARMLLEDTLQGVDTVARRCGFGNTETMRRAFLRELGVPPSACRERFRSSTIA